MMFSRSRSIGVDQMRSLMPAKARAANGSAGKPFGAAGTRGGPRWVREMPMERGFPGASGMPAQAAERALLLMACPPNRLAVARTGRLFGCFERRCPRRCILSANRPSMPEGHRDESRVHRRLGCSGAGAAQSKQHQHDGQTSHGQLSRLYCSKSFIALSHRTASMKTST